MDEREHLENNRWLRELLRHPGFQVLLSRLDEELNETEKALASVRDNESAIRLVHFYQALVRITNILRYEPMNVTNGINSVRDEFEQEFGTPHKNDVLRALEGMREAQNVGTESD